MVCPSNVHRSFLRFTDPDNADLHQVVFVAGRRARSAVATQVLVFAACTEQVLGEDRSRIAFEEFDHNSATYDFYSVWSLGKSFLEVGSTTLHVYRGAACVDIGPDNPRQVLTMSASNHVIMGNDGLD
jgi:hypothetical protein